MRRKDDESEGITNRETGNDKRLELRCSVKNDDQIFFQLVI